MVEVTFIMLNSDGSNMTIYADHVLDRQQEWILDFGTHTHSFSKVLIKSVVWLS